LRSKFIFACCVSVALAALFFDAVSLAQAPARGTATQPPRATTTPGSAGPTAQKADANLQQLMRGILYPSSNVIFAAQGDLAKFPAAPDASTSPNPLTSSYGGWQAVENAGLALVESANLLLVQGRMCANGKPVPVRRPDWVKYVQGLRQAGMAAYKAAQSKNQDAMVDVSGTVTEACTACHDVYREKPGGLKDRCLP